MISWDGDVIVVCMVMDWIMMLFLCLLMIVIRYRYRRSRVLFAKMTDDAILPSMTSDMYDLYPSEERVIDPSSAIFVSTGISVTIPKGYCGIIHPIPLISLMEVDTPATVVTTGEIEVLLHNNGSSQYFVRRGFRIAQLIIVPVS